MGLGSTPKPIPSLDSTALAQEDVFANVAFDLFVDHNPSESQGETSAETEVMIWLGMFGYAYPLGYKRPAKCRVTMTIGHVELYVGHP
jgi:Glycosyl hydrolase family 12.